MYIFSACIYTGLCTTSIRKLHKCFQVAANAFAQIPMSQGMQINTSQGRMKDRVIKAGV